MKTKLIFVLCLIIVICTMSLSTVFASNTVIKNKSTNEFGILTGILYKGVGYYWPGGKSYEFSYNTEVTKITSKGYGFKQSIERRICE